MIGAAWFSLFPGRIVRYIPPDTIRVAGGNQDLAFEVNASFPVQNSHPLENKPGTSISAINVENFACMHLPGVYFSVGVKRTVMGAFGFQLQGR